MRKMFLKFRKQISFLFIGGLMAVIDPLMLYIFNKIIYLNTNISITLAYFISIIIHFTLNNIFVFRKSELNMRNKILRYAIVAAINYCINLVIINSCITLFNTNLIVAKYIAILLCMLISYFGMNHFIFRNNK